MVCADCCSSCFQMYLATGVSSQRKIDLGLVQTFLHSVRVLNVYATLCAIHRAASPTLCSRGWGCHFRHYKGVCLLELELAGIMNIDGRPELTMTMIVPPRVHKLDLYSRLCHHKETPVASHVWKYESTQYMAVSSPQYYDYSSDRYAGRCV